MTGLVAGIAFKSVLGGALGKVRQAASWFFLHPAWLVTALACLFAFVQWTEARHWKKTDAGHVAALKEEKAAFALEKKAFATEKVSLDAARAQIADTNNRILAQAADLEQAKRDAAAAVARNANLARSTDARIAALQTAATKHGTPCTLSDEAKKELDNQ